jgi:flagellar basal-body rod modification protein FlgD
MPVDVTSGVSAESIRTDYMQLLVTQLSHQDPMDPMDSAEMTQQLAMLAQTEQLENLNARFGEFMVAQELGEARGLVGWMVEYANETTGEKTSGLVTAVEMSEGKAKLLVGEDKVTLDEVLGAVPYYQDPNAGNDEPTVLVGDTNLDDAVNDIDLQTVLDNFGMTDATWRDGDFNSDGVVDHVDYEALMQNYVQGSETGEESGSTQDTTA